MSSVSVIFDADTGRFVSNVGNAEKSVVKASEQVAKAKNATIEWTQASVEAAKAAGASYEQLNRIMTRGSARLASITEQNATRIINARNREIVKTKELTAAQAELSKVVSIERAKEQHSWKSGAEITRRQMASGLLRATSGKSSLRAAEVFSTMLPGFDAIASVAFPIVGAMAFGTAILGAVNGLMQMEQEEYKVKQAQDAFGLSVQQTFGSYREKLLQAQIQTDDLTGNHLDKLQKELQLIDAQDFDNLSSAFGKLAKNATTVLQTIKANWLDTFGALFTSGHWGAVGSKGVAASMAQFQFKYQSALANQDPAAAQKLLNDAQDREEVLAAQMDQVLQHRDELAGTSAPFGTPSAASFSGFSTKTDQAQAQKTWDALQALKAAGINVDSAGDLKKQREAEQTYLDMLADDQSLVYKTRTQNQIHRNNLKLQYSQANRANATSSGNVQQQAAETIMRGLEMTLERGKASGKYQSAGDVEGFWASAMRRYGNGLPSKTNPYLKSDVERQYYVAQTAAARELTDGLKTFERWTQTLDAKGVEKMRQQGVDAARQKREQDALTDAAAKSSLSSTLDSIKSLVTHGYISTGEGAQQEMSAYQQYGRSTGLLTANNPEGAQLRAHIEQLELETEPVIDQLFDHIRVEAQQTSEKIKQITETFIDGFNDQLANGMTGQKMSFGGVFQQAAHGLAKTGLERMEGLLFGGKGKPDGSQSKPFYIKSAESKSGIQSILGGGKGSGSGSSGGLFGNLLGWANNNDWLGSHMGSPFGKGGFFDGGGGSFLSSIGGLFHFALGGPVAAGVPVVTGELGREVFVPSTPGTIIPHSQAFGSTNNVSIDARGAHDPAQTYAAVHRAMRPYVAMSGPASLAAQADHRRRTPQHSKR